MDSGKSGSIESSSSVGGSRSGREDQESESGRAETLSALLNPTSLPSLYSLNDGKSFQHQLPNYYKFDPPPFSQSIMINNTNNNSNIIVANDMLPKQYYFTSTSAVTDKQFSTCATNFQQLLQPSQLPQLPEPSSMDSGRIAKSSPGQLNPKKRSRASRRTPTTVLTTDTNNFRQMVQELTGIPASPLQTGFTPRPRLDRFGGFGIQLDGSSMSNVSSSTMQPPHHLMRPLPQKILPPCYPINVPNYPKVTSPSFLPRPSSVTTVDKFHISGFRQGDPIMSLGSKATDSLMNEFALGHNISNTTTTTTCATTIGQQKLDSGEQGGGNNNVSSANLAAIVDKGAPLQNHRGVSRGEATVDSWICSSDS